MWIKTVIYNINHIPVDNIVALVYMINEYATNII